MRKTGNPVTSIEKMPYSVVGAEVTPLARKKDATNLENTLTILACDYIRLLCQNLCETGHTRVSTSFHYRGGILGSRSNQFASCGRTVPHADKFL